MTKVLKQPVCRLVAGFASMITVLILRGTDAGKYVEWTCFVLLPNFCFNDALLNMIITYQVSLALEPSGESGVQTG